MRTVLFALGFSVLVLGCAAVGPDYQPVAPKAPAAWHADMAGGLQSVPADPEALAHWWHALGDPVLENLIQRATRQNLDIKAALARVREARALRGVSRAGLFPSLDATASASRLRGSENGGTGTESELYTADFDAGWELDVFGGVRRGIEAARADLEAGIADLHGVCVSLLAEVAVNYLDLRTYQGRLAVAETALRTQQKAVALNRSRLKAGIINALALQQSLVHLESTRSQIPRLKTAVVAAKNRLAVLLGEPPGALEKTLAKRSEIPVPPITVAVGVPADTLRHRPDVRSAERRLAAATARIGVATAELYPKFRLAGTIGLESVSVGDLFEWASRIWKIGPSVSWNIFDAGAVRKKIEAQTARQQQALIAYQSTLLKALEEVENALTAFAQEQQRKYALDQAVSAAKKTVALTRQRYEAGLVDMTQVLDARQALESLQDQQVQSAGAVTADLVRLYKALGGGWESIKSAQAAADTGKTKTR